MMLTRSVCNIVSVVLCLNVCLLITGCDCGPVEHRLVKSLLEDYNTYVRPVANESDSVVVTFGIDLQQIIAVDEKAEVLRTVLWLRYHWTDYSLRWNESEYPGVSEIRLPASAVWKPDVLLYNSADKDIDTKVATDVFVWSDGRCNWVPLGVYVSSCGMDIAYFPFDDQICTLRFASWTNAVSRLDMQLLQNTVALDNYAPNGQWNIVNTSAERIPTKYSGTAEPFVDILFKIHIRRRPLYYFFNVIAPATILSVLTLFTFIQPPDAGEKVSLGVSALLALTVFQLIVSDIIPATSMAVPLVGKYITSVMLMCVVSIVMNVCVCNLHNRTAPFYKMSPTVRRILCQWLPRMLCMSPIDNKPLKQHPEAAVNNSQDSYKLSHTKSIGDAVLPATMPEHGVVSGGQNGLECDVRDVLMELRYITDKLKNDEADNNESNDWKFAAMVIDRLCLWVFTVYLFMAILVFYLSVPNFTL